MRMDPTTKDLHPKSSKENQSGKWRRSSTPDFTDAIRNSNSSFDGRAFLHQKILGYLSWIYPLRT
jgi:hypothetical protein